MTMIYKNIKKNKGVTIIEGIVAAALLSSVLFVAVQTFNQAGEKSATIQKNYDVDLLILNIRNLLSSKESCTASLKNLAPDNATGISELHASDGTTQESRFKTNTLYGKIQITNYKLFDDTTGADEVNTALGSTNLQITIDKGIVTEGPQTVVKNVKIYFDLNSGNTIESCTSIVESTLICDCVTESGTKMNCFEQEAILDSTSDYPTSDNTARYWLYTCFPNQGKVRTGFVFSPAP